MADDIVPMPLEVHYSILVFYRPYSPHAKLLFIIYPTYLQRFLTYAIPIAFIGYEPGWIYCLPPDTNNRALASIVVPYEESLFWEDNFDNVDDESEPPDLPPLSQALCYFKYPEQAYRGYPIYEITLFYAGCEHHTVPQDLRDPTTLRVVREDLRGYYKLAGELGHRLVPQRTPWVIRTTGYERRYGELESEIYDIDSRSHLLLQLLAQQAPRFHDRLSLFGVTADRSLRWHAGHQDQHEELYTVISHWLNYQSQWSEFE